MRITEISVQKSGKRFNVFVEGEFWMGVSAATLTEYNLYSSKEVDQGELTEVFKHDLVSRIYDRCVGKIARRPNSEKEIRDYIRNYFYKKGKKIFAKSKYSDKSAQIRDHVTDEVLEILKDKELVSDEDFAEWWVRNRVEHKPRGWMKIKNELFEKGIPREIIRKNRIEDEKELKLAQRIFEKITRNKSLNREKLISRLKSKGFTWDVIKETLKKNEVD